MSNDFSTARIGDKVYSLLLGEGTIKDLTPEAARAHAIAEILVVGGQV